MDIASETVSDGVLDRRFYLEVGGERVPGVMWSRATKHPVTDRPIVLLGHGGVLHKTARHIVAHARNYATVFDYTVVAIDAPNHGERPKSEHSSRTTAEILERMKQGQPVTDLVAGELTLLVAQTVPEWQATLDAVQALPDVGSGGRVGYWGVSMAGAIGVSLAAAEPRIHAAILGLTGLFAGEHPLAKAAAQLTIPVEFVMQWDDEIVSRESALGLFNAIASRDKSLHLNPGKHVEVPVHEHESWQRFFQRHLLGAQSSPPARP
jgi:cephalosporin-C deacetylase-like acetyl esterase